MKKRIIMVIVVLVVAATSFGAYKMFFAKGNKEVNFQTEAVKKRDIASSVQSTGVIRAKIGAEVKVGARISGKVEKLYANIGDVVKNGQVIAELEKTDLEAMVAQRQAELQSAEAKLSAVETLLPKEIEKAEVDIAQWEATLILAKKELVRQDNLLKKDFTSQQAVDRSQEQLSVANAQLALKRKALELLKTQYIVDLEQARAEVNRAKATMDYAKTQIGYATITAPISGVISSVATQQGETVAASALNVPTFVTIVDLNRLEIYAYVDETDIGKIKPGLDATFTVDSFPDKDFKGKVTAIYPKATIQDNVVYYITIISIGNSEGKLKPDMTVNAMIYLNNRENVLAVPNKAIKREGGKKVITVLENGKAVQKAIKTGWKDSGYTEVIEGIREGDLVIVGEAVKAENE